MWFQYTAARRRLQKTNLALIALSWFQYTAARRRLGMAWHEFCYPIVSIHSRPKAAGRRIFVDGIPDLFQYTAARRRLSNPARKSARKTCFNTQPPEGGCFRRHRHRPLRHIVSIHSRPKAAVCDGIAIASVFIIVSIHSRPKAAEPLSKALLHQVSQPRFR